MDADFANEVSDVELQTLFLRDSFEFSDGMMAFNGRPSISQASSSLGINSLALICYFKNK
jgi:hypothetical protein